jgi:predicted nucleotide-binding protein
MKMNFASEIFRIADTLSQKSKELDPTELDRLINVAEDVGKSWSGSWLGYHSRVYYKNLSPIPPGARFSKEWGFKDAWPIQDTVGEWNEYNFDDVVNTIKDKAGNPDLDKYESLAKDAKECFEESQSRLLSILSTILEQRKSDKYLEDIVESIRKKKIFSTSDFAKYFAPSGQQISRDMNAIQAGLQTPPHISVIAQASSLRSPFRSCEELNKFARRAASHIENVENKLKREERIGTNIFIGHGRSKIWKDLKDFIQDRLHLPWDEFNRVPVAGVSNISRLSRMLDEAAIAFLIMTAEDEQADGKIHARMNVIHEVGLFQGRLGFERAIVLLEEGCEEFSNINGLGQLRFPKGNISAIFEDIRRVLEREELIEEKV